MNRYLLDFNTLLALLDPRHVFHEAAPHWVERAPAVRCLTCHRHVTRKVSFEGGAGTPCVMGSGLAWPAYGPGLPWNRC
jgi:hypothetical protein